MTESSERPKQPFHGSPEKEADPEVRAGIWHLTVRFLDWDGKTQNLNNDIRIAPGDTIAQLEKNAVSYASSIGLHNFGMDTHYSRYPEGHPVEFNLAHKDESDATHVFSRNFNGSGYPVKPKSPA